MTQHQGLPVAGYRAQSEGKVEIVNRNKVIEEKVLRQFDFLSGVDDIDKRWLAIGRTAIEQGFMAANRAVFQPGRVSLPEDAPQMAVYAGPCGPNVA